MLATTPFYHSTLRNYIVAFGDLFNNIHVVKTNDANQSETVDIKVPVHFSTKTKIYTRLTERSSTDPNIIKLRMTAPRIGFDVRSINYDPARQLNAIQKIQIDSTEPEKRSYAFQRVPYNIDFDVYVFVKHIEEGLQIVEQILPYFTPNFNITLKDFPGSVGRHNDLPIYYNGMSYETGAEGVLNDDQIITFTLQFQMRGYFYGPLKEQNIIRHVEVNWRNIALPNTSLLEKYELDPDPIDADPNDDYGYTETITTY